MNEFCAPDYHQLEYKYTSDRETLYQCTKCPYFEFQYQEFDGL